MDERIITRREFLAAATAATAVGPAGRLGALAVEGPTDVSVLPHVVQVSSDSVVRGRTVHATVLSEMLDMALRRVSGASSAVDAWHGLLRRDDIIGLKSSVIGRRSRIHYLYNNSLGFLDSQRASPPCS